MRTYSVSQAYMQKQQSFKSLNIVNNAGHIIIETTKFGERIAINGTPLVKKSKLLLPIIGMLREFSDLTKLIRNAENRNQFYELISQLLTNNSLSRKFDAETKIGLGRLFSKFENVFDVAKAGNTQKIVIS